MERGDVDVGHVAAPVAVPAHALLERRREELATHIVHDVPEGRRGIEASADDGELERGVAAHRGRDIDGDVGRRHLAQAGLLAAPVPRRVDVGEVAGEVARIAAVPQLVGAEAPERAHPGTLEGIVGGVLARDPVAVALHGREGVGAEARVEAAADAPLLLEQVRAEIEQLDAQMMLEDVLGGKADEGAHLLGDRMLPVGGKAVAAQQRGGVDVLHPRHRGIEPLVFADTRAGLAEELGRGGERGHHAEVVAVIAGAEQARDIEHGGEHDDARQLHAALAEQAHEHGVADRAVRLAEDVERARPAAVLGEPCADGAREGVGIAIGAEDLLGIGIVCEHGPAGAQGIQEDDVAVAQQGLGVVLDRRIGAHVVGAVGGDALGSDAAEIDGHARAAGTAVVGEGDRTRAVGVALGIDCGEGE